MSMTGTRWQKLRAGDVLEHERGGRRFVVNEVVYQQYRGKPRVVEVIAVDVRRLSNPKQWRVVPKAQR